MQDQIVVAGTEQNNESIKTGATLFKVAPYGEVYLLLCIPCFIFIFQ